MQKKITYEPPEDVYNIAEFYWDDYEIQLRTRGLKVFRVKAGTQSYEELEKIIVAISPDRIRAYNLVNAVGIHYELMINFPKQVHEPFEHIHEHLALLAHLTPEEQAVDDQSQQS
jgi:hypothetical protein